MKKKTESKRELITIVPFAGSDCSSWRFPDGSVVYDFLKAREKAEDLGMALQQRETGRFSRWH